LRLRVLLLGIGWWLLLLRLGLRRPRTYKGNT